MGKTLRALAAAGIVLLSCGAALAKLPPPPPMTDAQKAAAEEKKAKDAAAAQLANLQLEKAMDRSAANYFADMKAKGKAVPPAQLGPTVATAAPAKAAPPAKAAAAPAAAKK